MPRTADAAGSPTPCFTTSNAYVIAVESYAGDVRRDERAFYGYYDWQVFYRTVKGTYLLPVGHPGVRAERHPR